LKRKGNFVEEEHCLTLYREGEENRNVFVDIHLVECKDVMSLSSTHDFCLNHTHVAENHDTKKDDDMHMKTLFYIEKHHGLVGWDLIFVSVQTVT
jgi:hypothetical protein